MSKGNMLLGQARGKVGDLVFYVRNGSQQTRPRNRQPANPQTRRQMAQRVKMGAPVGFYKRQAKFFQFAFKKTEKESFYNAFMRYNMNLGAYLTREEVVDGYKVPGPYIIADGNMPSISVLKADNVGEDLNLHTSIAATTLPTWGNIKQRYGLLYGDMMTIVVFDTQSYRESLITRVIIQHVFDAATDDMPIGYDMGGTGWGVQNGRVYCTVQSAYFGQPQFHDNGSAIILSRNNGNIDCSFAQLTLNDSARDEYESRRTDEALELAITSYANIDNVILDPISADDNMSEFITIYSDGECTIPISSVDWSEGGSEELYIKRVDAPAATNCSYSVVEGSGTCIEDVGFYYEEPGTPNGILSIEFSGQGSYAVIRIEYKTAAGVTVGYSTLTINN